MEVMMGKLSAGAVWQDGVIVGQQCSTCKEVKPLEQFYRDQYNKTTGRQRRCTACSTAYAKEYQRGRRVNDVVLPVRMTLPAPYKKMMLEASDEAGLRPGELAREWVIAMLEGRLEYVRAGRAVRAASPIIDDVVAQSSTTPAKMQEFLEKFGRIVDK